MSKWKVHNKWVCKMAIPFEIADYMQRAIDSKGPVDKNIVMPEDFATHCQKEKIVWAGHKNLAIADIRDRMHDRARHKVIQAEDLKFLLSKSEGEDYVKAYYMHFILDYLVKMDYWMKTTGDNVSVCVDKYMKNKAVVVPGTNQCLLDVVEFLKANSEELKVDYNLK